MSKILGKGGWQKEDVGEWQVTRRPVAAGLRESVTKPIFFGGGTYIITAGSALNKKLSIRTADRVVFAGGGASGVTPPVLPARVATIWNQMRADSTRAAALLVPELEEASTSAIELSYLLQLAEIATSIDVAMRDRMKSAILHACGRLSGIPDQSAKEGLWAGIRRVTPLLSESEVDSLLFFVRSGHVLETLDLVFQRISVYFTRLAAPQEVMVKIEERAFSAITQFAKPDVLCGVGNRSVLVSAIVAAACVGSSRLPEELKLHRNAIPQSVRMFAQRRLRSVAAEGNWEKGAPGRFVIAKKAISSLE